MNEAKSGLISPASEEYRTKINPRACPIAPIKAYSIPSFVGLKTVLFFSFLLSITKDIPERVSNMPIIPDNEIISPKSINARIAPIAGLSEKISPLILGPFMVYDLNRKVSPIISPTIPLIPSIEIWNKDGIFMPSIAKMVMIRNIEARDKRIKFSINVPILLAIFVNNTDVKAHRTAVASAKNSPINIKFSDRCCSEKRCKTKKKNNYFETLLYFCVYIGKLIS